MRLDVQPVATLRNAGGEPARILETISPGGFERYFAELVELRAAGAATPEQLGELCGRYALEMDPDSVPGLLERFDLQMGKPS